MRFTAATLMASGAMAAVVPYGTPVADVSTAYTTQVYTIISCAPDVTNCPARSTAVSSTVLPLTTSTIYSTRVHTITSCAPTVTNCPAHSTVLSTETVAVYTTVCPVEEAQSTGANSGVQPTSVPYVVIPTRPAGNGTWYSAPASAGSSSAPAAPYGQPSSAPYQAPPAAATTPAAEQCVPSSSVTAITKSYTTVYTSVEYSTIEIPCSTGPAGPGYTAPATGSNSSAVTTSAYPPVVTGAAGAVVGSAFFAGAAALAALVLA